jgi:acyl-CoA thioester hydrolase
VTIPHFQVLTMKKITFDLDIYPYQIDFAGHVNNAVYINWMEIGRQKLLEAVGMPISTLLDLSDRVWIEVWLSGLGYTSTVIHFNFYNAGTDSENIHDQVLVAEGFQRGLFVDATSQKPKRFTPAEKSAFLPYLDVPSVDNIDLRPKSARFRSSLSRSNE